MKVRNYYYLIAGILAMLFAITHAWNGQSAVLPTLEVGLISLETRTVFTYVWHIITVENLVFGIVFILMSLQSERSKILISVWMIVSILIFRLMVILCVTAFHEASALTDTLIDSITIVIYIAIIIMGTRKNQYGGQSPQSSIGQ
ncbi:hypothetical protein EJP82_17030 [Paenibacillus anaericanus]|uniref:Uncharacterized protein n=1 Tax=Paenibacillus anaericanus TaxID=170367 RepID=A0A433Y6Z3_9BACL|nr:hypothetical protein EJP82_17030 [Paenibacillus anaericanus]